MRRISSPFGFLLLTFSALALILLPLAVLACGAEEPTERPTRERRERTTEASDERDESQSEDRSERRGLIGRATREGSVETDREALVALYEATDGDNWFNNENWLTDAPLGEWYGITTDRDGRVWEIQLDSNGLDGEIPAEIGALDSLVDLNLDINVLRGPIPPELGDLVNLEKMNLVGNGLIGDLPRELARLSNLRDLVLPGNNLSGSIPSWLTELTNLEILYLTYNDFSGDIPRELGEMGSLVRLELGHNNLTGQIPAELGLLEDLVHLGLENNRLSGDIPDELEDLHSLLLLGIAGNPQLEGCVPGYLALQLDSSSDLGDVPVCGGLALGGREATMVPTEAWVAEEPTATWPAPAATAAPAATVAPTWTPTPAPWPTEAWEPTPTPWRPPAATAVPAATWVPTATPWPVRATPEAITVSQTLEEYAKTYAGGPGAIYVGDLSQLVGPAPTDELGDRNGGVPLDALQRHWYIYESDYYWSLLDKARLTDPTRLSSREEQIVIQIACINRALLACKLLQSYFAPNVLDRTNGQVEFVITSYPEQGMAGPDVLKLIDDGFLDASVVYSGYVSGDIPGVDIQSLWGIFSTAEESYRGTAAIVGDLDPLVEEHTGGGRVISHNWYVGTDPFVFCTDAIESSRDFRGRKTRSHSASLSDWINGMGGVAQFLSFADVYTALERGILDCGVIGADAAFGQRWYEVTAYLMGPIYNIPAQPNVINRDVWNHIPADLQQIILEQGARLELEALRLAAAQNEAGLIKQLDAGMEYIPFSAELQRASRIAAMSQVVRGWVNRVGSTRNPVITETFNNKLGPIVGMRINSDGSVTDLR